MSPVLLSRNPDLQQLRGPGVRGPPATDLGHLVVDNVPYVNSERRVVRLRKIVSKLTMAGDETVKPVDRSCRVLDR